MRVAAIHGEFDAVHTLLRHGARIELSIATALGRVDEARRLLPTATAAERHWAMAVASQFAQTEILRTLLDAGEDPNRYNPLGGHSHGTPLHQAAGYGYLNMVRLLIERGARLDLRDTLWEATPREWAQHEGRTEVEQYLRTQEQT